MFKEGNKLGRGRIKGSKNVTTVKTRKNFHYLLENNMAQLQEDLDEMGAVDRFKCLMLLARFCVPTLKSTELTTPQGEQMNPIVVTVTRKIKESE